MSDSLANVMHLVVGQLRIHGQTEDLAASLLRLRKSAVVKNDS